MASTVTELLRRRFGGKKGILPQGYTQLDYIQSANKSVVLTPYQSGDTFEIDAICDGFTRANQILLGYGIGGGWWIGAMTNGKWGLGGGVYLDISANSRTLLQVTFTSSKATLTANGLTAVRNGGASSGTIYIFGVSSNFPFNGKVYSIKKYNNNVVAAHFIPCTEDATSKIGFYDIINNNFIEY